MRSTMFSPCVVACDETRKSTARPVSISEMRPSCGARVSAMFIFDITLMRTAMAGQYVLWRDLIWRSTPSMR